MLTNPSPSTINPPALVPNPGATQNSLLLGLLQSLADGLVAPTGDAIFPEYADRPVEFIHEVLGIAFLTDEQKQIIASVQDNTETNVQAAHSTGKTSLSAWIVAWFVLARGGLAVTTAPTNRQVKELLWSEIRKALDRIAFKLDRSVEKGMLFFKVSEQARAYGFASYAYSSDTFQGIHNVDLLIVLDESNGISQEVYDGAIACITGTRNRLLAIGNPTAAGTPFEKACRLSHIRIPAWSHPNVSWAYNLNADGLHRLKPEVAAKILDSKGLVKLDALPKETIPGAISIAWIEKIRRKYGEGSAYWMGRVEARFPTDNANSIVPRSWFLSARARYDHDPEYWDAVAATHLSNFGLDVGDGGDAHALARWQGPVLYSVEIRPTLGDRLDTIRAADWAAEEMGKHPRSSINVDRTGVGAGTLGLLIRKSYDAHGVHWGSGVSAKENAKDDSEPVFLNLKIQQYWQLREAFRKGEVAVAPLGEENEEMLMEELAGTHYEVCANDAIRVEDKTKTKRRIGRSPNAADASCLGYASNESDYLDGILGTLQTPFPLPIDPELEAMRQEKPEPASKVQSVPANYPARIGLSFSPGAGYLSF